MARPLVRLAATLLGVSLFTFVLLELVPGDAAELLLSQQQIGAEERIAALRQVLGLDAPLPLRYARWLGRAAVLDFGHSFRSGEPVSKEILSRLPVTLNLALLTFAFVLAASLLGGTAAALFQNRLPDRCHRAGTILAVSVPDYWLALMLLLVFALKLRWLPVVGGSGWKAYLLPTLALGMSAAAAEGRVLRASILEVLSQDYVLFARAKGLPPHQVFFRHVLLAAVLPMISVWGMLLGASAGRGSGGGVSLFPARLRQAGGRCGAAPRPASDSGRGLDNDILFYRGWRSDGGHSLTACASQRHCVGSMIQQAKQESKNERNPRTRASA